MMLTFTRCASLSDDRNGALLLKIAETGAREWKELREFMGKDV